MRYLGGKSRIAKKLVSKIIQYYDKKYYIEPFVGSGWVLTEMMKNLGNPSQTCWASDIHPDLMMMWQELQRGWIPPTNISEDKYNELKHAHSSALRGFVGFSCSWGGKWFGGYSHGGNRNLAAEGSRSLLRKVPFIKNVLFGRDDYKNLTIHCNTLAYCDIPYKNTTKFNKTMDFNHDEFWNWARQQEGTILISEYEAPKDFKCILEIGTKTDLNTKEGGKSSRMERLFINK